MTALDHQPTTLNVLANYNFKMVVNRLPNVVWNIQTTNIPGLGFQPAEQPNPLIAIPQTGDHLKFEPLMVEFKIDEQLSGFREIYDWLVGLGFPNRFNEYKSLSEQNQLLGGGLKSDISMMILSSSRNPLVNIVYKDAFPINLSGINFQTTTRTTEYLTSTITFDYTSYSFEPV